MNEGPKMKITMGDKTRPHKTPKMPNKMLTLTSPIATASHIFNDMRKPEQLDPCQNGVSWARAPAIPRTEAAAGATRFISTLRIQRKKATYPKRVPVVPTARLVVLGHYNP